MEMTKEALVAICKEHDLYRTAALNDKLFCNFKGFTAISSSLSAYCNLKALFLEGNALTSLRGLSPLTQLRCLFLQQNLFTDLDDMPSLPELDTLNISDNKIETLSNLSALPKLTTLLAAGNQLKARNDIEDVTACPSLMTLDIQNNKIDDVDVLDALKTIPALRCLYLQGNEVIGKIRNYRRRVVLENEALTYLDDRPIFEKERRMTEAWGRGGIEAERLERECILEEEKEDDRRNFEHLQAIRREGWRKKREALGLPDGDGDPAFDGLSSGSDSDDEPPMELTTAMERLDVEAIDRSDDGVIYLDSIRENKKGQRRLSVTEEQCVTSASN